MAQTHQYLRNTPLSPLNSTENIRRLNWTNGEARWVLWSSYTFSWARELWVCSHLIPLWPASKELFLAEGLVHGGMTAPPVCLLNTVCHFLSLPSQWASCGRPQECISSQFLQSIRSSLCCVFLVCIISSVHIQENIIGCRSHEWLTLWAHLFDTWAGGVCDCACVSLRVEPLCHLIAFPCGPLVRLVWWGEHRRRQFQMTTLKLEFKSLVFPVFVWFLGAVIR